MEKELKGYLKPGETMVAKFVTSDEQTATFEEKNGKQVKIGLFKKLTTALDFADDFHPILRIEYKEDKTYVITELDGWPSDQQND